MINYYRNIDKKDLIIDFASTNIADENLIFELNKNGSSYYCIGDKRKNTLQYITKLFNLLLSKKYDVVHINGNSATMVLELFIAKLCNVKVRIAHGHASKSNYPIIHTILYPLFKVSYTKALAVSHKTGEWLFKNNYQILNNAIDLEHYAFSIETRNMVRKKYNLEDKLVIGNVGKLNAGKNHQYLIKIFKCIHDVNINSVLVIAGGGSLEDTLKTQCKDLGLTNSVIFLGMLDDTSDILSAFDFFLFTSKYEGLGMALIEAQASGLFCLSSNTVPLETKVSDNIEYLSLEEDPAVWAKKLLTMPIKYDRIEKSKEAYDSITKKGYNITHEAYKLEKIYRNRGDGSGKKE